METTGTQTVEEYLEVLSSKAPVPGGGGASALAGALGSALGQMVANLTIGKKKYAAVEQEVCKARGELEALAQEFLKLADEDALAFEPLAKCYGLPSATEEERAYKAEQMESCLLAASRVPLAIMERAVEMMELLAVLGEKGSVLAVSDVGVAVQYARAAVLGAVMNVYINTKAMKDRGRAGEINARARELTERGSALADEIYGRVLAGLEN